MKRIIFDLVIFFSIFLLPWWVASILACAGLFLFNHFYEFFAIGVALFALYTPAHSVSFLSSPLWFSVFVSLFYIGIGYVKQHIILYNNEI